MKNLQTLIAEIIKSELELRDVPFTDDVEIDPKSIISSSEKIQELINEKMLEYLTSTFSGPSYEVDNQLNDEIQNLKAIVNLSKNSI